MFTLLFVLLGIFVFAYSCVMHSFRVAFVRLVILGFIGLTLDMLFTMMIIYLASF